jgi:hypothetical protein
LAFGTIVTTAVDGTSTLGRAHGDNYDLTNPSAQTTWYTEESFFAGEAPRANTVGHRACGSSRDESSSTCMLRCPYRLRLRSRPAFGATQSRTY